MDKETIRMETNRIFDETKNEIMKELKYICPKITPVNKVGFKLDYTLYWNGGFGQYAIFNPMGSTYCSKKVTLIQRVCFCTCNELMSLDMVAEELTNEVMKSYGGNRFSFNTSVVECTGEVSEDESCDESCDE